jgi:hypothetical protein
MSSPRRNRVDPWGDLHAVPSRGLFTGNRGCLVDEKGEMVSHHRGSLWIVCRTSFRGWRHPLAEPGRWTPLFFLDDAVALAAGHRPCGLCRRDDYLSYRDAVTEEVGADSPISATELNRRLAVERLRRGAGLDRARDRRLWRGPLQELPVGTMVIDEEGVARVVLEEQLLRFGFDGWADSGPRPPDGEVTVLTPPTSVAALRGGFIPILHPSVSAVGARAPGSEWRPGSQGIDGT